MNRIEINVQTGEQTTIELTPEEVAAAEAATLAEQNDPERLKRIAERLAADELKADTKFQNLIEKTPQQAKNWVENNFPSLTQAEQRDLATIVMAVGILGRRL